MTMRLMVEKTSMRVNPKLTPRLPSDRGRALHQQSPARLFPPQTASHGGMISFARRRRPGSTCSRNMPQHPDFADRASTETERAVELRARDRQRKLIAKIDAALTRLDDGTYGYCRRNWRADQLEATRRATDRDLVRRGPGTPRAARTLLSQREHFRQLRADHCRGLNKPP